MATVFLSYRRTDSPQACRIYEWLAQRIGDDAIYMDVAKIPLAVDFSEHIAQAIAGARALLLLIGPGWTDRIREEDDPVRAEIEAALAQEVPVLPVLVGNTPMPDDGELPASIAKVAFRNAVTVGVSHDFHTHMRTLMHALDPLVGARSARDAVVRDPHLVHAACLAFVEFLDSRHEKSGGERDPHFFLAVAGNLDRRMEQVSEVTVFLHRVRIVGTSLQLHILLSIWTRASTVEHELAGWLMSELERTPEIDHGFLEQVRPGVAPPGRGLKIRRSDEDPRAIWRMVTDLPLRLSLAYVVTIELGE